MLMPWQAAAALLSLQTACTCLTLRSLWPITEKYPGSGVRTLRLVLLAEASLKLSAAAFKSVAAVCGRKFGVS